MLTAAVLSAISRPWMELSTEVASHDVPVHRLMPRPRATAHATEIAHRLAHLFGVPVEEVQTTWPGKVSAARYSQAQHIADARAFVVSEPARFITGAALQLVRSTL